MHNPTKVHIILESKVQTYGGYFEAFSRAV
jgi:hypothetical protein